MDHGEYVRKEEGMKRMAGEEKTANHMPDPDGAARDDRDVLQAAHTAGQTVPDEKMAYTQGVLANPTGAPETDPADAGWDCDTVWMLECNVDDCGGEAMGYVMELLFAEGAKDAWFTPIFMKKNRPAYTLHVICGEAEMEALEHIIFSGTTTIGIRRVRMERTVLKRFFMEVETDLGSGTVKLCRHRKQIYAYPEFESVKKLCQNSGLDYQTVYHLLKEEAIRRLAENESSTG